MRRTPLRRKPLRDPVTPEDRADVFERDKVCVLSWMESGHVCRDVYGNKHYPSDRRKLTVEHVHRDGSMMGKRAPSTPDSMVALCGLANNQPPTKKQRDRFRDYLSDIAERADALRNECGHVDPVFGCLGPCQRVSA